jgi:hypothetical protein
MANCSQFVANGFLLAMFGRAGAGRGDSLEDPQVVRVQLENVGYIGFIYLSSETKLNEVRLKIADEIEGAPANFTFLMEERIPIAKSQEQDITAVAFYPMACMIRASKATDQSSRKVTVQFSGKPEFKTWITAACRFGRLREDACKFWDLEASEFILKDGDGYAWPEEATIESVLPQLEGSQPVIHLYRKPSGGNHGRSGERASGMRESPEGHINGGGGDFDGQRGGGVRDGHGTPGGTYLSKPDHDAMDKNLDYEQELWLIFTHYCVQNDPLDIDCMQPSQLVKMLKDCSLIGRDLDSTAVYIVHTAETKGKTGATKMNYEIFLNALTSIACRWALVTAWRCI